MGVTKLHKADIDSLHDTFYNVHSERGIKIPFMIDSEVIELFQKLPQSIQSEIEEWGASDTLCREQVYVWYKEYLSKQ